MIDENVIIELLKTLKHGHVDADKIASVCSEKEVDIGHVVLMSENLRDMLIKEHDRVVKVLNSTYHYVNTIKKSSKDLISAIQFTLDKVEMSAEQRVHLGDHIAKLYDLIEDNSYRLEVKDD